VVLMDEEYLDDLDEEDLDIGTEIDPDSPPWDMYGEPDLDDIDDSNEDTALLRTKAARTEIIVTPISPVINGSFLHFPTSLDENFSLLSLAGQFVARLEPNGVARPPLKRWKKQRKSHGSSQARHATTTNHPLRRHLRFSESFELLFPLPSSDLRFFPLTTLIF
jgi:hypothetical protein